MNKKVKDFLKVYDNFIDLKLCKSLVKKLNKSKDWNIHRYNDYAKGKTYSHEKELSVLFDFQFQETVKLHEIIILAINKYQSELTDACQKNFISRISSVRYNKYSTGTMMRFHCDHIHSLFDGNQKGVPVLSVLGALNDDYDGGDLVFWGKTPIELKAGSVMVFPSNFMYSHQVEEVTKGTRYSFVSWAW